MQDLTGFSKAITWRVVDADTFEMQLDLGFSVTITRQIRLARCNAPEIMTPEGQRAAAWMESLLIEIGVRPMMIYTTRARDRYGRDIAEIYYTRDGLRHHCLSDVALLAGAVTFKDYGRHTQPTGLGLQTYPDDRATRCK